MAAATTSISVFLRALFAAQQAIGFAADFQAPAGTLPIPETLLMARPVRPHRPSSGADLNLAVRGYCPMIDAPTTQPALPDLCKFVKDARVTLDNPRITLEYVIPMDGDE